CRTSSERDSSLRVRKAWAARAAGLAGGVSFRNFLSKTLLFNAPDAHQAPAGDGHVFDQSGLIGREGLEFGFERRKHGGEGSGVFSLEDDSPGEDAVAESVFG